MKNLLPFLFLSFLSSLQLEAMNASRRGSSFLKKEESNVSSLQRNQAVSLSQRTNDQKQYTKTSSTTSDKVRNNRIPLTSSTSTRKQASKPSILQSDSTSSPKFKRTTNSETQRSQHNTNTALDTVDNTNYKNESFTIEFPTKGLKVRRDASKGTFVFNDFLFLNNADITKGYINSTYIERLNLESSMTRDEVIKAFKDCFGSNVQMKIY